MKYKLTAIIGVFRK